MMKVVSFLIKILKYKVLSFLVSNFDILADSLQQIYDASNNSMGKIMEFKIFVIIIMPPSKILTAGS